MHRAVYWQTFTNRIDISKYDCVILAAVHFGVEDDGEVYMHLNDKAFEEHRDTLDIVARERGYRESLRVGLMIGGAGGGWNTIRDHFDQCVELLNQALRASELFDFIDLDPEAPDDVDVDVVVRFMRAVRMTITVSPITIPTNFWNIVRAHAEISVWHIQTYDASMWSANTVKSLVEGGWPLSKICFGYTGGTFSNETQKNEAIASVRSCGIRSTIEWDPVPGA